MDYLTQPLIKDIHGNTKFKENEIVVFLLNKSNLTLTEIDKLNFNHEDKMQFMQLIGSSLMEFGQNPQVSHDMFCMSLLMEAENLSPKIVREKYLEIELAALRVMLREPISRLYGLNPSTLK